MPTATPDRRPLGRLGLSVAGIGLGTGSFQATNEPAVIRQQATVVRAALLGGMNLIDCASNYAGGAAEALVGCVLEQMFHSGAIERRQVVVCSKAGYADDGHSHRLEPAFIDEALATSLARLQLAHIDLYLVHNPEEALLAHGPRAFAEALMKVFGRLEAAVAQGRIGAYGVASAEGLRHPGPGFHAIDDLVALAERVGGAGHHFAAIQLPFSVAQPEAWWSPLHGRGAALTGAFAAARACGLGTIASASLNRMRLPVEALKTFASLCPRLEWPAQVALQFARSAPGVDCALVGTSQLEHLAQALDVLALPPLDWAAPVLHKP